MSDNQSSQQGGGLATLIRRYPLVAYFVVAFAGTWLFFAPLSLSQRGLGWLPIELSDTVGFVLYFLATYTGPFAAAFLVTGVVEGKAGIKRLARRMVQWRVGIVWYLVLLIGYPALLLLGVDFVDGGLSLQKLAEGLPLMVSVFLPSLLFGIFFPSLGEETGWRGFALPRMQASYGPLAGSLLLGVLHALWHLPAYPVRGLFADAGWDTTLFVANSLSIILATLLWTWLFNNGKGSVLFAILIHATSNASSALVPAWLDLKADDPWVLAKVLGGAALLLVLATRGRLGYQSEQGQMARMVGPSATPAPTA